MEKRSKERRRSPRYYAVENIFVAFGERISKVGIVIDISMCGLAFEYIPMSNIESKQTTVEIFVSADQPYICRLPCRKVYEIPALACEPAAIRFFGMTLKRCGIEFISMSKSQEVELSKFIKKYITARNC